MMVFFSWNLNGVLFLAFRRFETCSQAQYESGMVVFYRSNVQCFLVVKNTGADFVEWASSEHPFSS